MIVMEIRELEAFLAVMSTGSITAAARLLDRSQSQVTRLIQDLEISVGFALFDRNGPKIAPSEKGIAFHAEAERFLSGIGHLRERARTIAEKEPQPIEIVAIPAFASGIIPLALAALPEKLLPRKIHLRSLPAEAAVQSVLARTADFCVTSLPADQPGLEVHGVFQGPCVAAVAVDDPLAACEVISIADLAGRNISRWPILPPAPPVDIALEAANIRPARIIATSVSVNAVQIASTGLGVAIVEPATAYGLKLANVAVRPLDVDIPFPWAIFSAAARPLSDSSRELIQAIIQIASACIPGFTAHDPRNANSAAEMTLGGDQADAR
ncbi:LysR family transcriptional regulator [Sinorhizobium meliloti CCBAU 01290]|nr:LysR family transcriptional regulator [Sinorhizobium meliloti CCBAU 01290]